MTVPASPAQVSLITRLLGEKEVPAESRRWISEALAHDALTGGRTGTASRTISHLFACPKIATEATSEAKPGFYVRGNEAFRVQMNKAGTHTYALVWSGHSWEYSPGSGRSLADLVPMTAEQAAALGLASGRCINCCRTLGGASLSSKVAALIGYGETCAANYDWFFPKGAANQRIYVETRTMTTVGA
jgi:hypothetical protein